MTDELFEQLLWDSFDCFGEDYFTVTEESVKKHRFSMHFYWSMRHTRRVKQSMSTVSQKRRLAIVMTVMILLSALTLTACGFWSELIGYITHVFEDHTQVKIMQDSDAPETIETFYTVSELPEGYELERIEDFLHVRNTVYTNHSGNFIFFIQEIKRIFSYDINSEGYELIPVTVNNYNGYAVMINNEIHLSWETEYYIFTITTNEILDLKQLVKICESVKRENYQ